MYNQLSKPVSVSFPLLQDRQGGWRFDGAAVHLDDRGRQVAEEILAALLAQSERRFDDARELYLWMSGWMLREGEADRPCKVLVESLGVVTARADLISHAPSVCLTRLTDYR